MSFDRLVDEKYLANTTFKLKESIDYADLVLPNEDRSDVHEEDISDMFDSLKQQAPKDTVGQTLCIPNLSI
jgi:hypothetical protein